ncbi:2-hydroxyhepta-2,4-diene-1,7-dioate isomerase [Chromobacterium haemolyticum]|uniref:fumarylacetoacetate hydrolase family protein n=1 Tax=Chromobacterium haemolyticum TaxID=394935 RepID=UPI0009DA5925|nr:fumarylacetoacetate hydrolase family protein [Chromobacterium haemolyticum]OQS32352.1 2-hydroxyhepta-2,4-diene-1,7-dioate isomerase [Chromobacterium haemolyticum]
MRHARIRYQGQTWRAQADADGAIVLPDGRRLGETEVEWLPPCQGTLFALGLNYADHAAELDFKPPSEPLVFLKTPATLTGHRQQSMRPDNVEYMHYECELVAVIGKTARKVKRAQAMDYVAGYTICNDYAVRDYLENYYRPNLRVKNRDGLTPIGPWLVDRDDVPDPHCLELAAYVNGRRVQSGNTRDMVFDIPFLIEYLSAFMTLQAGDMIATGTPQGLSDVRPGDEVVVEVAGVGRLLNHIISETDWLARRNAEKETP